MSNFAFETLPPREPSSWSKNGSRNPERVKGDPLSPQSTLKVTQCSPSSHMSLPYSIKIAHRPKISFPPSLLPSTLTMTFTNIMSTVHNDVDESRSHIEESESSYVVDKS